MSVSEKFSSFLNNIKVLNSENISHKYGEITSVLNNKYRDTSSDTANTLKVGSYGRWSAINGISDLDMIYIMPASSWDDYKDSGQLRLLQDTKDAIKARYPRTDVYVDSPVVRVLYTSFHIEVQPAFEQEDGSFKYPDTSNGGAWKITKPREEMQELSDANAEKNRNLRRLCKMARAWKNKHGVPMGGLLIDTLAHRFLKSTTFYDDKSYLYYDYMSRDFFYYLSQLPDQEYFAALGSGQRVKVKKKFQKSASIAYQLCLDAIAAEENGSETKQWRKVYGRHFPATAAISRASNESLSATASFDDTEQFIELQYPVDIRKVLVIECEISQNGFRENLLRNFIRLGRPLSPKKKLRFFIESCSADKPYRVLWKVLNRGSEAERRNCIRGQIKSDSGYEQITETTDFNGDHIVECYIVQNDVVVARDRIHVPIG